MRSPEVEFLVETRDRAHTESLIGLLSAHQISVALAS